MVEDIIMAGCAVVTLVITVIVLIVKILKWGFTDDEATIAKKRYKTIKTRYPYTFSWIKRCILEKDSDKCCHYGSMDTWYDKNEIDRESYSVPIIHDDVFYPLQEYFLIWTSGEMYRYREDFVNLLKKDKEI